MGKELQQKLIAYSLRLGDDALVLGHRVSEWVSYGPFLEEDIALGNVALDYIGRARMFYTYAAELTGEGKTEDDFAFMRTEREFKNYLINELPRGNFAYTTVRQLMVDVFNIHYLEQLRKSKDETLAAIAEKGLKETRYHVRRSRHWTLRLGDGTEESHKKMQRALDDLWGFTHELFEQDELEQELVAEGIAVNTVDFREAWLKEITTILDESTLKLPQEEWTVRGGRRGYHTEYLGQMLSVMQSVHRAYPGCQW